MCLSKSGLFVGDGISFALNLTAVNGIIEIISSLANTAKDRAMQLM